MDYIIEHKNKLFIGFLILVIGALVVLLIYREEQEPVIADNTVEEKEEVTDKTFVDIKGAIKKPGVYQVDSNAKVIDVIELAGGLNKDASTKNINLSARVKDEMVIYIFTKKELTKEATTSTVPFTTNVINYDKCITTKVTSSSTDTTTTNSLVNINTASKEELMTLTGVGESKALNIIKYREENNGFKKI